MGWGAWSCRCRSSSGHQHHHSPQPRPTDRPVNQSINRSTDHLHTRRPATTSQPRTSRPARLTGLGWAGRWALGSDVESESGRGGRFGGSKKAAPQPAPPGTATWQWTAYVSLCLGDCGGRGVGVSCWGRSGWGRGECARSGRSKINLEGARASLACETRQRDGRLPGLVTASPVSS